MYIDATSYKRDVSKRRRLSRRRSNRISFEEPCSDVGELLVNLLELNQGPKWDKLSIYTFLPGASIG